MKKILLFSMIMFSLGVINAQVLVEGFSYPSGNITNNGDWVAFSAEGTDPVQVVEGGLTFDGYGFTDSDGKSIRLRPKASPAEDVCIPLELNRPISSGPVYLSFLLKVDKTAPVQNDPKSAFISFGSSSTGKGRTRGRLATVETSNDKYKFRIMWFNTVEEGHYVQYDDREFDYGNTYLAVLKYNLDNHEASAYFFDARPPQNEPANPDLSLSFSSVPGDQHELPQIRSVQIWQNGGRRVPQDKTIDGVVVSTSWQDLFKKY